MACAVWLIAPGLARADSNCAVTQDHSIIGETTSAITFFNNSGLGVDIYWLNYPQITPSEVKYFALADGARQDQPTWLTHPWKAIDPITGACLGYTISDSLTKTYVVQPPSGPLNLSVPIVSGAPKVGQVLTAIQGTYDDTITSYAYRWERCPDGSGTCVAIDGATGSTYRVQTADVGRGLRVVETATSLFGKSTDASSALVAGVALSADLQVSLACTINCSPAVGDQVTFTGTVENAGPDNAASVFASVGFSASPVVSLRPDSVQIGQDTCNFDGRAFCSFPSLLAGTKLAVTAKATITAVSDFPANIQANLSAGSGVGDPNSDNNSATVDVSVLAPPAVATNVSVSTDSATTGPGARQIPLANIDLAALPTAVGSTASAPIASIPIASIPIASIPIASIPIASIGFTPGLLDRIGGVPLASIPLQTAGGWDARLLGTPLAGSMLQVTTLADVMRQAPGALTGLTLADVGLASSPIASIPIASIALGPLLLSDLPLLGHAGAQNLADWCAALSAAGFACANGVFADGSTVASATMASIGIEGAPIASIPIASIPIASIPIASIPIASIPIASIAPAGSPIASIPIASIAVAGSPIASIPIASIPVASIPAVVDCVGYACATKTLGQAAADQRIRPSATLADLGHDVLATMTLGQLGPFFPPEITLADVLALIAGPAPNRNYELLPFTKLPAPDWRSVGATQTYKVRFTLTGGSYPASATVNVTLPPGFRYGGRASFMNIPIEGPGTPTTPDPPKVSANALSFHIDGIAPAAGSVLELDLRPSLILGPSGPVTATVMPDRGAAVSGSGAEVEVVDPARIVEGGPPTLGADTIHFSYITSATDTDTFRIPAPPTGSRVTVKLVPPQGADYDLAVYRPTRTSVLSSPIASIPLDGEPVPDQGMPLTHAASSQAPETLADIPIASIPLSGVSDSRGSAEEVVTAVTQAGDAGGSLTVQVSGYQGSTSSKPYVLLVAITPPPDLGACAPRPPVPAALTPLGILPSPAATSNTLNTLLVVDSRRLQAKYPGDAQGVMSSLDALALRSNLGVTGAVLDVAADPAVVTAENAWDASPCRPETANEVARAVATVVSRYTSVRPSAKYLVLVGGDDEIPFFRLPDLATVSNESDYASTFAADPNQYFGSLASGSVLSDNPYGSPAPTPFFDRYLYVPSLSVGRLVETPADIVAAVNQFVSSSGALSPSTALVSGYDFLADGSKEIAATEAAQRGAGNLRSLIDDPSTTSPSTPWSAAALDLALGASPPTVLSLNAHYDHYRLLPSDQGALFNSSQMAAKALAGRFVFTMGCHSGLSVSDIVVGASAADRLDWPQVYGAGKALYAANTGYGYGDTTGVAYSEKLMSLLAKRMDGTVTAGEALMFAKNDFKSTLGPIDVYDEKVLSETTFYGLPMYRVGPAVALPPAPAPRPTAPEPAIGGSAASADLSVSPPLAQKTSPFGTYFASTDTVSVNYRPVEPSTSTDVTEPNLVAHGALITQLSSTDIPNFNAAFSMPTIDRTATAIEPIFGDAVFPTKIQTVQTYADPRGTRQRLVLVAGQFASDPALAPGVGRQRNFTQIDARVYYSPPSVSDFTPAQFGLVQGAQIGGQAAFSVRASDNLGTGVKRVLVGYHDGAVWKFVDLQQSGADPGLWTGGGPSTTVEPEFFVQAVDGGGNVSVTSYKGRYYLAPPAPAPSNGVSWTLTGTHGANGWFTSDVVAAVTAPAGATVDLDGGLAQPPGSLTIAGDGVHLLGISVGGATTHVPVGIDRTSPTVTVSSPVDGATITSGDGTALRFSCADAGSGIRLCTATLNGTPISGGGNLSSTAGVNSVVVTATDAAGNTASKTVNFVVLWTFSGFFSPVDNLPMLNVIKPGQAVPVKFSLGGNRGLAIFVTGYPRTEAIACSSGAVTDAIEQTVTAGGSSLQYDAGSQQYIYVWKTPSSGWPTGTCRQLVVKFVDSSIRRANFKAK